ncbi:MAG: FkbM family methyltransferase [Ferruginibacter sp.]
MKKIKIIFRQFPFLYAIRLTLQKAIGVLLRVNTKQYFSQTGEDIIIQFLIEKQRGFYVDVGCNHPISFSNTFELYKSGWVGLNIDANPELIKKFKIRPRDISVCAAVSDEVKEMVFYEFEQSEVSTLETTVLDNWKKNWNYKNSRKVITKTLTQILEENSVQTEIDFLSIDVEGHDLQVLKSLDFAKYKPRLILIEIHNFDVSNYQTNEIVHFLDVKGYDLVSFATMNGYFKRRKNTDSLLN